jgi:hypothetical protein
LYDIYLFNNAVLSEMAHSLSKGKCIDGFVKMLGSSTLSVESYLSLSYLHHVTTYLAHLTEPEIR